jgi:hypothetical protein
MSSQRNQLTSKEPHPKKMTSPLYMSIAGPISCITGSTSVTGGKPSSFQALDEMLYRWPL